MKRVFSAAVVLLFAACADTPTQPNVTLKPELSVMIGTEATWAFEGWVLYDFNSPLVQEGDIVKGTVNFKVTGPDDTPNDICIGRYPSLTTFTYEVNGTTVTTTHAGEVMATRDCYPNVNGPQLQINANGVGVTLGGQFDLVYPADSKDIPLTPPALVPDGWPRSFQSWDYVQWNGFTVYLTRVEGVSYFVPNPQIKADCFKDGWKRFGFKNQGMCVSYIETGKDSR